MKIIILRNNLKIGLDTVGRAIGSNLNLPVLGNILIRATKNQIQLSATNLELAITKNVFGKVVEEGSLTVPYNILSSIVSNVTSERINLEKTKQGNLGLSTDNYKADIQGINEKEFPIIPSVEKGEEFMEISSPILKQALGRVIVAGEISEFRPEISGVLFRADKKELKLVATDSFRLSEATIAGGSIKNKFKNTVSVTIPLKAAQELNKIVNEEKDTRVYINKNQALFMSDETTIITRLVDGDFPDYAAILPKNIDTEILINREELLSAVKLASSFSGKTSDVILRVKDKKILEIYSADSSVGENNYLIPVKVKGPETEATFNWRYLLDGVRVSPAKELFLGLNGDEKPALIKGTGDNLSFYILMPIRPA